MNELTEKTIGRSYAVANTLGHGFLEKVYENALAVELRNAGCKVEQQKGIVVNYHGSVVGEYVADLLVDDCVIVELKTVKAINDIHLAQALNYLKATGLRICLLINFGNPKVEIKRVINGS
ncbi:MAG: GxxExxY protein [Armatimonadota bacterium]|nr:GxxExxY protein [Armatimonadota bacterium]